MGDELQGCECIFSHELAMRRLISFIRQSQSYCTDSECIDLTTPPSSSRESLPEGENFAMLTMVLLFAVILFFLRPSSFRPSAKPSHGPGGNGPNNGAPPAVN